MVAETVDKLFAGEDLEPDELEAVDRIPLVTDQLLAHVPRLEAVREIVRLQNRRFDSLPSDGAESRTAPQLGARVLKVVLDCDTFESHGHNSALAIEIMRQRTGVYDPEILEAFSDLRGVEHTAAYAVRELPLHAVVCRGCGSWRT